MCKYFSRYRQKRNRPVATALRLRSFALVELLWKKWMFFLNTVQIGGWWWWKGGCPTPCKKGGIVLECSGKYIQGECLDPGQTDEVCERGVQNLIDVAGNGRHHHAGLLSISITLLGCIIAQRQVRYNTLYFHIQGGPRREHALFGCWRF